VTVTARFLMILAVLAAGASALAFLRCEGDAPAVALEGPIWIGTSPREVAFRAEDPGSGLRQLEVTLKTAEGPQTVLDVRGHGGWLLGTAASDDPNWTVSLSGQGLADGEGTLTVRATDWSWAGGFQGNTTEVSVPVRIDTTPPRIRIESGLTYVKRGGAAAVTYRLDAPAALDGVRVGDHFFRGFPASQEGDRRIAVFAVARDAPADPEIRVVATDLAGNAASRGWATQLQEREFDQVKVKLPERFFEDTVPELAAHLGIDAPDMVAKFRAINEGERATDEARIAEITRDADEPRHFMGGFLQLRNSKVMSRFAEQRSYRYDGQEISRAIHYGYDLAATSHAPVEAANAGRVIFAQDLGIYGNCVILDHGLGVTSLYGHLSEIDVAVGDLVERGQVIGHSGATGFAGGDHLHFAILVGGVYVDPLEWWDAKWVHERVEARALGSAP
jgi:murein DD-endopeptidase MepM/ murein hydrolase activator NlpD